MRPKNMAREVQLQSPVTPTARRTQHPKWSSAGLDLVTLRIFRTVVRLNSIVRAAERENIAVSAVSRRIACMETRLGTTLLRRHVRGVEPTEAGNALMHHLDGVFHLLDKMILEMNSFSSGSRGHIRLFASLPNVAEFLPRTLAQFKSRCPQWEVVIEERHLVDTLNAVEIGTADLGLVWRAGPRPGLTMIPCRSDSLVVAFSKTHRFTEDHGPIKFTELLSETLIGLSAWPSLQERCREEARATGATLVEQITIGSVSTVCRMVEADLGVTILPQTSAEAELRRGEFRFRVLDEDWGSSTLSICVRHARNLPYALRLLIDHLVESQ